MGETMEQPISGLRDFLQSLHTEPITVGDNDDLIEKGIVDSLRFLEFIHLIEELSGRTIDVENLNIDDFRTLSRIDQVFFNLPTMA